MSAPRAGVDDTCVRRLSTYVLTIAMHPNYASVVPAGANVFIGHRTAGPTQRQRLQRPSFRDWALLASQLGGTVTELSESILRLLGEAAGRIAELAEPVLEKTGANDFYNPDVLGDHEDITDENVWKIRGTRAPGAFDMSRRRSVMDAMGVQRQFVFPS